MVDEAGGLRGLITIKDIEKAQAHPNASTDGRAASSLLQLLVLVMIETPGRSVGRRWR